MSDSSRRRLVLLVFMQGLVVILVIAQLIRLQIIEHKRLSDQAIQDHSRRQVLKAPRGQIFDRNGDLLVGNSTRYEIRTDPGSLSSVDRTVNSLSSALGMPLGDLRVALGKSQTNVLVATELPMTVGRAIDKLGIWAVSATPYWRRAYPEGSLAAHVLGFVTVEEKGYYGVEGYYEASLRGQKEEVPVVVDVWLGLSPFDFRHIPNPRPGTDLVLTIDRTIQALTEGELARALAETGAQSGTIIVLDPHTGDILAMASLPAFDPNAYPTTPASQFVNPAISMAYEPGSVFKILTMASALQSGTVQPDSVYNDMGCSEMGGQVICNWDRQGHGVSNMVDLLAYSSNVGAATLSTRMGAQTFYRHLQAFGIGTPSGVDLQGEAWGSLRVQSDADWHESDLATHAFGQGLSATPLQMVVAVAAVANDGIMMRPRVVAQMINRSGDNDLDLKHSQAKISSGDFLPGSVEEAPGDQVETARPAILGSPISAQVAHTLVEMLAQAVEREVPQARVPGYRIAGKTGTAQIPVPGGYYDDPWTIASFIGFGPVRDPQFVILVKLDRPTISPYGSTTAAPVFQRLAARLFILRGIAPDDNWELASLGAR
ncbi:MAG: penicillin-binding protein 2 [Thermoflexales bacterium]|nr:penicillin-binding protein 2 [Thermoflexales bacterium]